LTKCDWGDVGHHHVLSLHIMKAKGEGRREKNQLGFRPGKKQRQNQGWPQMQGARGEKIRNRRYRGYGCLQQKSPQEINSRGGRGEGKHQIG